MKPVKIGKYEIKYPIIQGGMGVGISWEGLAGNVSLEGGLGVLSSVGTGYYKNRQYAHKLINNRPVDAMEFNSRDAMLAMIKDTRAICGDAPLAVNVMYALNDYGRIVQDCCEGGVDIVITGAGLPVNMPEFTKDYPDVAIIPMVSSARALKLICKKWKRYNKLPDAIIVEGPLSGGHQGFGYDDCFKEEYQLENIIPPIIEEAKKWGDFPVFAAGGIWDKNDIDKFIDMGCAGVQMATRFIGTVECDAHENFKEVLVECKEEDIELLKSPVGYPARGIRTKLLNDIDQDTAPKISCISNCIAPCNRGEEAKQVKLCVADRLADAYEGKVDEGLFFTGANGYRINEIITVKELMKKLVQGE
jgi:nitronate monooxygenase